MFLRRVFIYKKICVTYRKRGSGVERYVIFQRKNVLATRCTDARDKGGRESIGIIMNNLGQRKDIIISFITASCALRSMLAMKRSLFQLQILQQFERIFMNFNYKF